MKTGKFIIVLCVGLIAAFPLAVQDFNTTYFIVMPKCLSLNDEVQKYFVVTTNVNSGVYGNFFNRMQVRGSIPGDFRVVR